MLIRYFVSVCLGALLLLISGAPSRAEDVFDRATLDRYSKSTPHKIFEHPVINCYLRNLVPPKHYKNLQNNMQNIELYLPVAENGAYVFSGFVRGLAASTGGVVMIHPDGRLWVAVADGKTFYFTNDPQSKKRVPQYIRENWGGGLAAAGDPAVAAEKIKQECGSDKVRDEMQAFLAREQGLLCDSKTEFSSDVAVVSPKGDDGRAYFHSRPLDCTGGDECFTQLKSYLVRNDLVLLAEEKPRKGDFWCVSYQAVSGRKTAGWVRKSDLEADLFKDAQTTGKGDQAAAWAGEWGQPSGAWGGAGLTISRLSDDTLKVEGSAAAGAHTGEVNGTFRVTGVVAKGLKNDPEDTCTETIHMRLLSNAMYLKESSDQCGGIGVSFTGAYYRTKKKEAR